jgi:hypothetical protein
MLPQAQAALNAFFSSTTADRKCCWTGIIAALLFSVAGINLITKQVATISGVAFTLASIRHGVRRLGSRSTATGVSTSPDKARVKAPA